jgi:hypothetical protein
MCGEGRLFGGGVVGLAGEAAGTVRPGIAGIELRVARTI